MNYSTQPMKLEVKQEWLKRIKDPNWKRAVGFMFKNQKMDVTGLLVQATQNVCDVKTEFATCKNNLKEPYKNHVIFVDEDPCKVPDQILLHAGFQKNDKRITELQRMNDKLYPKRYLIEFIEKFC